MINMLDYDVAGLGRLCLAWDQPSYRARQIIKWVHREGCSDPMLMTDLPKAFRQKLAEEAAVVVPSILKDQTAQDGTRKWLLGLSDGNAVETVFIPEERRGTLCVSSQVGCMLQCDFCATGKQGFNRNLSLAEIIGQLWLAVRLLSREQGRHDHQITNVVMMGMGEPLLNVEAVVPAMNLMLSDDAYGLSKRRVTLSTSGIVPEMMSLYARSPVALAVSLHAANNALRDQLVPINRKYPLEQLIPLCRHYFDAEPRRRVMFEYVMLEGVNDTDRDLRDLGKLLSGVRCKINLIPFNTFQGTVYRSSSMSRIRVFRERLDAMGFHTTIRKTRGDDRQSACGQLTAEGAFLDKTRRRLRFEALTIERGVP